MFLFQAKHFTSPLFKKHGNNKSAVNWKILIRGFCVFLSLPGDGKQTLCGLGDSSVLLYKSSLTGNPAVYTGAWSGHE